MTKIQLVERSDTFKTIHSAVNKMVDMIKPTYGPANNKVVIDKQLYRMVVDDGVQIARDLELEDPAENAIVRLVRETAIATNDRAGDGTTGALILLQAIINEVKERGQFDGRAIEKELKRGVKEVAMELKKRNKKVTKKEDLKKVALISYDNEEIADMISGTYHKLGPDGVITIDKSPTLKTTMETTDGLKIDSGYISPYMVTNPQRMETEISKPKILITDYRLTDAKEMTELMQKMAKEGKNNLIVIADNIEDHALATMIINLPHVFNPQTKKNGSFLSVGISAASIPNKKTFLEDLSLMTGATMFTASKGNKIENAELSDLGTCDKIIIRQDQTILIKPGGKKGDIATAITSLRESLKNEEDKNKRERIASRLAQFSNTLAVIKVGAHTDNEQKALKYKVEDTVHAVKSAFRDGVVCGAGLALDGIKTSSPILNDALQYPSRQLLKNVGIKDTPKLKPNEALNVVTGETGNFMDVGVVDPTEVLRAGVESAVSIASILLTSSGMVVELPDEPNKN